MAISFRPTQMAFNWRPLRSLGFWPGLFLHYVLAVVGSIVIGFVPEIFVEDTNPGSILEPYSPMILIVAGFLGYLLNKSLGHPAARWIWVLGVAWLAWGAISDSTYWYNSNASSRMQYIWVQFFGTCTNSECAGQFLFTTPCAISIIYSVAAAIGLKSYQRGGIDESGFPLG
jgi:hypothetical protein